MHRPCASAESLKNAVGAGQKLRDVLWQTLDIRFTIRVLVEMGLDFDFDSIEERARH